MNQIAKTEKKGDWAEKKKSKKAHLMSPTVSSNFIYIYCKDSEIF